MAPTQELIDALWRDIAMSAAGIDWEYVHHWCDVHGTRDLLASVMAAVPKE